MTCAEAKPAIDPAELAPCIVCREPIRKEALVCTNCDSRQDWTRHLARWGGIAAAIVGIASLVTTAVSLWKLVPSPAEIEASEPVCTADDVRFALHNIGDKTGAVRTVSLEIVPDKGKKGERIILSPEPAGQIVMVEAGKSAQAHYVRRVANAQVPILDDGQAKPCRYVLSLGTSGVKGSTSETKAECKCP